MKHTLVIRPLARQDMEDAYDWYEKQRPGRGDEFALELRKRMLEILENPEIHGRVRRFIRAATMPRSKFLIYYRVKDAVVTVIAVQHARANPKRWQRRK